MATIKKYQSGGSAAKKQVSIPKQFETKGPQKDIVNAFKSKSSNEPSNKRSTPFGRVADMSKTRTMRLLSKDAPNEMQKNGGKMKKAKSGGSFPDLNKDGKITKADILKGRGVIAKSGTKMKPKANYGKSMMSKGGKMKMGGKC
jgi:hypothetical protein